MHALRPHRFATARDAFGDHHAVCAGTSGVQSARAPPFEWPGFLLYAVRTTPLYGPRSGRRLRPAASARPGTRSSHGADSWLAWSGAGQAWPRLTRVVLVTACCTDAASMSQYDPPTLGLCRRHVGLRPSHVNTRHIARRRSAGLRRKPICGAPWRRKRRNTLPELGHARRCRLVVVGIEVRCRFGNETLQLLRVLARHREAAVSASGQSLPSARLRPPPKLRPASQLDQNPSCMNSLPSRAGTLSSPALHGGPQLHRDTRRGHASGARCVERIYGSWRLAYTGVGKQVWWPSRAEVGVCPNAIWMHTYGHIGARRREGAATTARLQRQEIRPRHSNVLRRRGFGDRPVSYPDRFSRLDSRCESCLRANGAGPLAPPRSISASSWTMRRMPLRWHRPYVAK